MSQIRAKLLKLNSNWRNENVLGDTSNRVFTQSPKNALKLTDSSKVLRQPLKSIYQNPNVIINESSHHDPTKFIDLNYDCLEHILRDMTLNDLQCVGSTCTYLQSIVCRIFNAKFRKNVVFIDCNHFPIYTVSSCNSSFKLQYNKGNNVSAFLNVFGEVISNLVILNMFAISNTGDNQRFECDARINHSIVTHCRQHVIDIKFRNCGQQMMHKANPFTKVTKVLFDHCILGKDVSNFQHLFPAMRKLEIIDCNVTNVRDSIETHFPQLECFNLSVPFGGNCWSNSSFTIENVKIAIEQNPHLKSLKLCYWNQSAYDANLLKYAAVHLNQLKTLQLWHLRYTDFCGEGDIHFASVEKLTFANYLHDFGRLECNLAAISFENLNNFCMIGEFDNECTTFIARHKTIKKLSIIPTGNHGWYPLDEDIIRISSVLPNLERIIVNGLRLTTNGLLQLINQHQQKTIMLIKVRRYVFSAAIRKLFQVQCRLLGWDVTYHDTYNGPELIMQQKLH